MAMVASTAKATARAKTRVQQREGEVAMAPMTFLGIRGDNVALIMLGISSAMMLFAVLYPRWRVDSVGTEPLKIGILQYKWLENFKRDYGLLVVRSGKRLVTYRQTSSLMCSIADISMTVGLYLPCYSHKEQCYFGHSENMLLRCTQWERLSAVGYAFMGIEVVHFLLLALTSLAACYAERGPHAAVIAVLICVGAVVSFIFSIIWIAVSDWVFKRIMETSWYPYPRIGFCFYLHLFACLVQLAAGLMYFLALRDVILTHDPADDQVARRERQYQKARRDRELHDAAQSRAPPGGPAPPPQPAKLGLHATGGLVPFPPLQPAKPVWGMPTPSALSAPPQDYSKPTRADGGTAMPELAPPAGGEGAAVEELFWPAAQGPWKRAQPLPVGAQPVGAMRASAGMGIGGGFQPAAGAVRASAGMGIGGGLPPAGQHHDRPSAPANI